MFVHIAEMLVKRVEAERLSHSSPTVDTQDNDRSVTLEDDSDKTQRKGACCS